jgi:DNA-binding MarR family transcriptional regulator
MREGRGRGRRTEKDTPEKAAADGLAGAASLPNDWLLELYLRPGFMIRRAHQIAISVYVEETAEFGVTPTQHGILYVLAHRPDIDQMTVAHLLGLDRSTTGTVLKTLEDWGLVRRVVASTDRRRRLLELTDAGQEILQKLAEPAARQVERLLSPFDPKERAVFIHLLSKLTGALNAISRVPVMDRIPADPDPQP